MEIGIEVMGLACDHTASVWMCEASVQLTSLQLYHCVLSPYPSLCQGTEAEARQVGTPPWCQPLLIKLGRTAGLLPLEHGWCILSFFIRESKEPATLPRVNPVTIVT